VFVVLILLTALLADYAIRVLFLAVERMRVERPRYPSMGRAALGRSGELLSSWVVTLQQIGACIAYVVIIGDVLHPIVELTGWGSWVCERWPLQLFLLVCVIFPLCLLPSMDNLKYVSVVSLLLIWGTVFAVVVNGGLVLGDPLRRDQLIGAEMNATNRTSGVCEHSHSGGSGSGSGGGGMAPAPAPAGLFPQEGFLFQNHSNSTAGGDSTSMRMLPKGVGQILSALPILAFAFLCHQNSFPIYKELIDPNPARMSLVGHWSISICCFVYMLSGLTGYYTFLENTESNLLKNFAVQGTYFSLPMDVMRTGFGVSMVLSFPLMVWEARHNLDVLIFGDRPYAFWRNFGLNLGIVGFTGGIGISVSKLDQVLTVVGSTCSPLMIYILPALFYLAPIWGDEKRKKAGGRASGGDGIEAALMDETEASAAAGVLFNVNGAGPDEVTAAKGGCCGGCVSERAMVTTMLGYGLLLIPCCLFVWVLQYLVCAEGSAGSSPICSGFGF
jgi:amino acid permease